MVGSVERISLVTDFGCGGPYTGQMKLRLAGLLPGMPVVDLISDLPAFRPELAAYLLPAIVRDLPRRTVYLCIVDPGVGGERAALAVAVAGDWYVGPDNGLLAVVARRAHNPRVLRVDWRPARMSDSFHGRDLFAPIAAMLSRGEVPASTLLAADTLVGADWPEDLARVIYVDRYGNLLTGLRANTLDRRVVLSAGGRSLHFARTFCDVPFGTAFWYENAFGLVELAVNQGRADALLGLAPGDAVTPAG